MGRWADLEKPYKTMDLDFMESIWWVFQTLWKKKLIYQGSKILAYSTRLHTPLSNFEVNLGYKDVQDPSIVVAFQKSGTANEYFLAWTTTPWTIPSNLALSVHPKIRYAKVASEGKFYYLAESLVSQYFKENFEIKATAAETQKTQDFQKILEDLRNKIRCSEYLWLIISIGTVVMTIVIFLLPFFEKSLSDQFNFAFPENFLGGYFLFPFLSIVSFTMLRIHTKYQKTPLRNREPLGYGKTFSPHRTTDKSSIRKQTSLPRAFSSRTSQNYRLSALPRQKQKRRCYKTIPYNKQNPP